VLAEERRDRLLGIAQKAKISARNLPHVAPIQHALPKIKTNESMVY
jgi:hypothetical protein